VGSEGTCANIVSATLNLAASPPFRVLTVLGFDDPFLAADAVPLALEHRPIGLEGFDFLLVEFMRRKGLALNELDRLPAGVGFLLVEMGAWTAEEAHALAEQVRERQKHGLRRRWLTSALPKKRRKFGMCGSRHWARWFLCRESRIDGKDGKTRPFLRRSLAATCARSTS
ncbi:MAG: hypothetical protein WBA18_11455, partial [Terracidiphilus sp.]